MAREEPLAPSRPRQQPACATSGHLLTFLFACLSAYRMRVVRVTVTAPPRQHSALATRILGDENLEATPHPCRPTGGACCAVEQVLMKENERVVVLYVFVPYSSLLVARGVL